MAEPALRTAPASRGASAARARVDPADARHYIGELAGQLAELAANAGLANLAVRLREAQAEARQPSPGGESS